MAKLVKLTSNIDLDLPASKFDLRSWKMWRGTYLYFWFWAFWCIGCWNRLKNGQFSEIDLQYWPRPPSFQVWPPILKNMKGKLHLFLILSILMYWTLKMAKLVNLISNIVLDLPASKFYFRSWKMCRGTYIYFLFWAFWCIEHWNR